MDVNYKIPVSVFGLRESGNPLYSFAKLKIFYIGMTPDKRMFTKSFSKEIIKTLPYVPVVAYYNEEDEDFVGHNSLQYIYGVVPESTNVEFIKEEGKEYAVCDIILYTGRKDQTGEIANKIVGKSHSLELNPDDTNYEIVRDEQGNFKYLEFTSGSLIGLSVLGDNEEPAFTGSEFFSKNEKLAKIHEELRSELNDFFSKNKRGEQMEKNVFVSAQKFIELSYSEKAKELSKVIAEKFEYFYIVELFDEKVIVQVYEEEGISCYRIPYTASEDNAFVLGESEKVLIRYYTEEEIEKLEESFNNLSTEQDVVVLDGTEENTITTEENMSEKTEGETTIVEETTVVEETTIAMSEQNSVSTSEGEGENANNEEGSEFQNTGENLQEEGIKTELEKEFSSTALNNSEREELNAFRKERKLSLIESFVEDLDKSVIEKLTKEVDSFSYDELEIELSKEFTKAKKANNVNHKKILPLYYQSNDSKKEENHLEKLINLYQ